MKKKGFTLMELLAVIVILAILALITLPIITNLIKNSKKEAFRLSVGQVSDNIFFHYTKDWLLSNMTEDIVFDFDTNENINLLTVSGRLPSSGTISINPQGKIAINVNDGVYCAVKTITEDKIQIGEIVDGVCTLTGEEIDTCPYKIGYKWNFDYIATGEDRSQEFSIPCDGYYKLEVWGASSDSFTISNNNFIGGYGGYSTGEIELKENDKIYVNIGEMGKTCSNGTSSSSCSVASSYNGGAGCTSLTGYSSNIGYLGCGAGGGATHIALDSGILSTFENKKDKLLIVAGGGGGANAANYSSNYGNGGSGGGISGGNNINGGNDYKEFPGGNQTTGAYFGNGYKGGGGGYYGGSGGISGSGGGSGYIGNNDLKNKYMYCYNCETSTDESTYTITGKTVGNNAISSTAKKGNGYARITYLGKNISETIIACTSGMSWEYDYKETNGSGVEQTFTSPCSGYYKLEVWGAQGGSSGTNYLGGTGGYSTGVIRLNNDNNLYINVGGQGKAVSGYNKSVAGGYNGGGAGCSSDNSYYRYSSSGGGATHIAFESGLLTTFNPKLENSKHDKLLIVAGGGGGTWNIGYSSGWETVTPGTGGGYQGGTEVGKENGTLYYSAGGNQTTGFAFGQGFSYICGNAGGGAGGGYYGGIEGEFGGSGGSGYIGYNGMIRRSMYCNNCNESGEESIRTIVTTSSSSVPSSKEAKLGNGYAKIIYLGESIDTSIKYEEGDVFAFDYKESNNQGVEQTFTVPISGKYKIEVWGAQGGGYSSYIGGYGGYSVGELTLNKNTTLYINVGGQGQSTTSSNSGLKKGGYNGGGNGYSGDSYNYPGGGGGATHIAYSTGLLTAFEPTEANISKSRDLIIVAGGGGAGFYHSGSPYYGNGGHGGGFTGGSGTTNAGSTVCSGGTQDTGGSGSNQGSFGQGGSQNWGTGGGGGYYGGGASHAGVAGTAYHYTGGSGGSGYIGNDSLSNKHMYCYNCTTSPASNINTYTISNGTNSCKDSIAKSDCAKQGNGYARITLLEIK